VSTAAAATLATRVGTLGLFTRTLCPTIFACGGVLP